MRELKFRAYRKEDRKMIYDVETPKAHLVLGNVVMQYTGLKDKYGADIYEGDMVQNFTKNPKVVDDMIDFHLYVSDNYHWFATVEVIGNIYENPELIKQEARS